MDVRAPKSLNTPDELIPWARNQLEVADQIIDNPGGGLLFATQAMGQVRAALAEQDEERWAHVGELLLQAEDAGVRRNFQRSRELVAEALQGLS